MIRRSRVRLLAAPLSCNNPIGKLFTHMCLCHQQYIFGSVQRVVTLFNWKGNAGLAESNDILPLDSPAGWLHSDRDQLRTQCLYRVYTVSHKKRATLFLTITPAFHGLFYTFCTSRNGKKYSTFIYLMAWWRHNCITSHVTNVCFIWLLLQVKHVEFEDRPNFLSKTCSNVKFFLTEDR